MQLRVVSDCRIISTFEYIIFVFNLCIFIFIIWICMNICSLKIKGRHNRPTLLSCYVQKSRFHQNCESLNYKLAWLLIWSIISLPNFVQITNQFIIIIITIIVIMYRLLKESWLLFISIWICLLLFFLVSHSWAS